MAGKKLDTETEYNQENVSRLLVAATLMLRSLESLIFDEDERDEAEFHQFMLDSVYTTLGVEILSDLRLLELQFERAVERAREGGEDG